MFEVGKLTDESLDSFLGELEKASKNFVICSVTLSSADTVLSALLENIDAINNMVTYVIDQSLGQKPKLKEYHQLT